MESENLNEQAVKTDRFTGLKTVTPLSKYLAMVLFIILPFVGGYVGYQFATNSLLVEQNKPSEKTFTSEYLSATVHEDDSMTVTFRSTYKDLQRIYFGDGNMETLESIAQYTYQEAGLYQVKLTGNCDNAGPNEGCIEPDIDSVAVCVGRAVCAGTDSSTSSVQQVGQQEVGTANDTYPYILTVEGPTAVEFSILSNEFEIGRFSSDGQFNYSHSVTFLRENVPNTVQIITDNPGTDIDISITRGDEVVCDPPVGTLTCTFSASPAYKLSVYNKSEALPKCADAEFLSNFLADLTPYQIAYFQNYFYIDIADLTSEPPIFIDPDDSCSENVDLEFTHEAVFEAAYSPRESLHVPFGSDRTVTLLFDEPDVAANASVAVGDNSARNAYLLLSNEDESRLIKLSGGAKDINLLLSQTR